MGIEVRVTRPGGGVQVAELIGRDSATAFLLRFGPMQPLYPFDLRSGSGRGRLKQWRVSEEQLESVREQLKKGRSS